MSVGRLRCVAWLERGGGALVGEAWGAGRRWAEWSEGEVSRALAGVGDDAGAMGMGVGRRGGTPPRLGRVLIEF